MKFDLWMPTASPMTTPRCSTRWPAGPKSAASAPSGSVSTSSSSTQYESRYPYADDGRIPAPPGSGLLEPMVTLTYLAARTTTVRLGTAMLLLPQRNPVYTAKEVSTLDWLSDGRVDLGIGVGWLKEEFDVLNVPWERRGRRTDEYLEVLRTLWLDETSSFHGEVYDLPAVRDVPQAGATASPRPYRRGDTRPPCAGRPVTGRAGTLSTARPKSWPPDWPSSTGSSQAVGRSRAELRITVCPYFNQLTPEWVEGYAEAGADAVAALFFAFTPDDVAPRLRRPRGLPGGGRSAPAPEPPLAPAPRAT